MVRSGARRDLLTEITLFNETMSHVFLYKHLQNDISKFLTENSSVGLLGSISLIIAYLRCKILKHLFDFWKC